MNSSKKISQRTLGELRRAIKNHLVFDGSDKHARPWLHPGRRGTMCPQDVTLKIAQDLLNSSMALGKQRFAVDEHGQLYCAMMHRAEIGLWHGFPKPWKEADPRVLHWAKQQGLVDSKAIRHFWNETRK